MQVSYVYICSSKMSSDHIHEFTLYTNFLLGVYLTPWQVIRELRPMITDGAI